MIIESSTPLNKNEIDCQILVWSKSEWCLEDLRLNEDQGFVANLCIFNTPNHSISQARVISSTHSLQRICELITMWVCSRTFPLCPTTAEDLFFHFSVSKSLVQINVFYQKHCSIYPGTKSMRQKRLQLFVQICRWTKTFWKSIFETAFLSDLLVPFIHK